MSKEQIIKERELSLLERYELMKKHNIPTKLITVTYNDKTIESYE